MRFQLGIQILLVVVALIIIFTVLKPKFAEIQYAQNEISQYVNALSKASEYNQALQALLNKASSIPDTDREALTMYLPTEMDEASVARDIKNIVEDSGLLLIEVSVKDVESDSTENTNDVAPSSGSDVNVGVPDPAASVEGGFVAGPSLVDEARRDLVSKLYTLEIIGSYDQMKEMLVGFERNSYPLEVKTFAFEVTENSTLYTYSIELQTYALKPKQQ